MAAVHGQAIVHSRIRFPDTALEVYWTASHCRRDRWARALKSPTMRPATTRTDCSTWTALEPVLDEVLKSEVLSRVWAAICCGLDNVRGREEAGPIANSVLVGHHEARNRVLNLMIDARELAVEDAVKLNHRRLRIERWTDMLLSLLKLRDGVTEFAFDPQRVRDWADVGGVGDRSWKGNPNTSLALSALAGARQEAHGTLTENEDLNWKIASSVLACLPPELFDSLGHPISAFQQSLIQVVADSQGQLNLTKHMDTAGWFNRRGS